MRWITFDKKIPDDWDWDKKLPEQTESIDWKKRCEELEEENKSLVMLNHDYVNGCLKLEEENARLAISLKAANWDADSYKKLREAALDQIQQLQTQLTQETKRREALESELLNYKTQ
jgi:predicted RNase H-like nuclease (RuvC/YqgF family)